MARKKANIREMSADGKEEDEDDAAPRTKDEEVWKRNFIQFYTDILDDMLINVNLRMSLDQTNVLNALVTKEEVQTVIDSLPNNKAPGPDKIPYGLWTMLRGSVIPTFINLFNGCKSQGTVMESARAATIVLLPKEKDSYACSMYRPISLTNTDYKILMRIWANLLGPILHNMVGGHQLGFIPSRDGRENIINTQFLIDYYCHNKRRGAALFMDLKKAFDKVSHKALMHIMRDQGWPEEFVRFIENVYKNNTANILVNGTPTEEEVNICSGTRQGCPLSPLLFTIIAEVMCQNIINNPNFKGMAVENYTKKMGAYADDMVALPTSETDVDIFNETLADFEKATAMEINENKSEAVMTG